ncbi:MAG: GNAT family N-acetyltransferase [Casimicrobiaceae bacterium]
MDAATLPGALAVLTEFLTDDPHYRSSSAAYGDAGPDATRAALELFLAKPELGFVFVARAGEDVIAACVVCYAISTSRGGLVVKLDDVSVRKANLGQGVGSAMLNSLKDFLRARGVSRIDCGCHRDNEGAWRFYERHGFAPLHEERLACLLA